MRRLNVERFIMSEQAQATLLAFSSAIIETVQEAGPQGGVHEGPMYAAFMSFGIDLNTFNQLVDYCIRSGKIRRSGHVLFAVE